MKEIQLTQGQFTIVDDDAPAWIFEVKWCAQKRAGGDFVAARSSKLSNGKRRLQYLHAVIAGTPEGKETLHINGRSLDNRAQNVKIGTSSDNQRGPRKLNYNNTTGRRGVTFNKRYQRFRASVMICLGYFDTADEAAYARDAKARELGWPEEGMNFPNMEKQETKN